MTKILILTSGPVIKLEAFKRKDVTLASFRDIYFSSQKKEIYLKKKTPLKDFQVIYFRMVGKSLEVATLVANYAKENGIVVVDRIYAKSNLLPLSLGKSLELKKLSEAKIPIPRTVFGDFSEMQYPFVIKSTTGQRAREVWRVESNTDLEDLKKALKREKFYFAQEFIPEAKRVRALVVGKRVVGAILRQTKWNKNGTKETLKPIPRKIQDLAIRATNVVGLEIAGVDILIDGKGRMFVIEVNAAPSWKLINSNCGVVVEDEILKYLQSKV